MTFLKSYVRNKKTSVKFVNKKNYESTIDSGIWLFTNR